MPLIACLLLYLLSSSTCCKKKSTGFIILIELLLWARHFRHFISSPLHKHPVIRAPLNTEGSWAQRGCNLPRRFLPGRTPNPCFPPWHGAQQNVPESPLQSHSSCECKIVQSTGPYIQCCWCIESREKQTITFDGSFKSRRKRAPLKPHRIWLGKLDRSLLLCLPSLIKYFSLTFFLFFFN